MGLRLIIGRAGTGKTKYCVESFKEELFKNPRGPSLILLVPEQATFQMEYGLVNSGLNGMFRGQVLSFRRLAYRVLQEVEGGKRRPIDEVGKSIVLRSILQRRKGELKLFQRSAGKPGFTDRLLGLLSEMHAYNITPEDLKRCSDSLGETVEQTVLRYKMHDLYLIYGDLVQHLEGLYTDPDDYLALLAKSVRHSQFLKDARIWVDGFAGFTPQEYEVLKELMCTANRVEITLCMDGRDLSKDPAEMDLFYPSRETYDRLIQLAQREGVTVEAPLILDSEKDSPARFKKSPELAHLERELFCKVPKAYKGLPKRIHLVSAVNFKTEVEAAAREIIRLCRDEGYRWREISVILRNIEPYEELLEEIFEDYGIPFFMDKKEELGYHPVAELIRSAIEAVISNWQPEAVLRYLKTDLIPIERDIVDRLENYVLARGICGRKAWVEMEEGDCSDGYPLGKGEKLSFISSGKEAVKTLDSFDRSFCEAQNVEEMTRAVFTLLSDLRVSETLETWRKESLERGNLQKAQEHSQVWNGVLSLLDQVVEIIGGEKLSGREYFEILEAGLEYLKLKLIPPSMDQVLIASIERSRHPEVKASFVLGVNEGVFPAKTSEEAVFSDAEREFLKNEQNIELAPTSRLRLLQEQFLVYVALTRPSSYLWVSYSLSGESGRALSPSGVIANLKEVFPLLQEEQISAEPQGEEQIKYICSRREVLRTLLRKLRDNRDIDSWEALWVEALRWFLRSPLRRQKYKRILGSLFYRNQESRLSPDLIKELYGSELRTSVSSMEIFASCPFAHFLDRALKLKPREEYLLLPVHRGAFFHEALKVFVEHLLRAGIDWGELGEDEAAEIIKGISEDLVTRLHHKVLLSSPSLVYVSRELQKTLERAVEILSLHARRGSFRPVKVEVPFGLEGELDPLEIDLGNGRRLLLRGRIDRVDAVEHKGKVYIRVMDYKSSPKDFRLCDLYNGLALQLMVYLTLAVEQGEKLFGRRVLPAGILYFAVYNPVVKGEVSPREENPEAEIRKELKMTGLLLDDENIIRLMDGQSEGTSDIIPVVFTRNGIGKKSRVVTLDQFKLLMDFVKEKLARLGRDILEGEVSLLPYRCGNMTACREINCHFRPVCGFDPLLGNSYRNLVREGDRTILERISKEMGGYHG